MRSLVRGMVVVLLAGCASSGPAPAPATPVPVGMKIPPGTTAPIRGSVSDIENSDLLQGTQLELAFVGDQTHPIAVTAADARGEFIFPAVELGDYMLHVVRPGYTDVRMRVEHRSIEPRPLYLKLRSLRQRCPASRYKTAECP